jgi:hypothetical protein
MTLQQAVTIRTLQLQGHYIAPVLLARAVETIQATRTPTRKPRAGEKSQPKRAGGA